MKTSTISFDKVRIRDNKIIFTLFGKQTTHSQVYNSYGQNIVNRISYKPEIKNEENGFVVYKKTQYEFLEKANIIFKTVKKIYDKSGKLIDIKKEIKEVSK